MNLVTPLPEEVLLGRLRSRYESEGYKFLPHPAAESIPGFLGDYKPDALALKQDEGIVIEVKSGSRSSANHGLSEVARRFSGQAGWRFVVISGNEPEAGALAIAPPTRQEIAVQLREVSDLHRMGHPRAALLLAWALLEAVARFIATPTEAAEPLSPIQTVQLLEAYGWVDSAIGSRLRSLASLRNAVAHGDVGVKVDSTEADYLIGQARMLVEQMTKGAQPT